MLNHTVEEYYRTASSGLASAGSNHRELVRRDTWWLFWMIPIYSTVKILRTELY